MAISKDELFKRVRKVLVDALGLDDDEVQLESRLVTDLGAESIDFLDIVFRLEKEFAIKIDQGSLFPQDALNDPKYVADNKVTDEGMRVLRDRMPHAELAGLDKTRLVKDLANVFTVEAIVRFVQVRLPG